VSALLKTSFTLCTAAYLDVVAVDVPNAEFAIDDKPSIAALAIAPA
jgi:hypothetical protein